ncbi:MAG TPA: hypothetical protein ENH85_06170 [Candidatus Scalindua sp.]|nr:hypothetical protein [Candidatus Scalindua sp.]
MLLSKRQKRRLRQNRTVEDNQAGIENNAISRAFYSKTMDFGKNLRMTYVVDGVTFRTGQKHRRIG